MMPSQPLKPALSILVPTRNRPKQFEAMCDSALSTATGPIEIVAYVDNDDTSYDGLHIGGVRFVKGPRIVLSQMWNRCCEEARGDYLMHGGDDLLFRTQGWDEQFINAFPEDKIAFVHGRDGSAQDAIGFGTHGVLHRNWVEAVGYFVPPHYVSDYNDTHLNEVADAIDRHVIVSEVLTEHLHPAWGKGEWDQTHQERLARHDAERPQDIYESKKHERIADAAKLQAVIDSYR